MQISRPVWAFSFHSINSMFARAEVFNLDKALLNNFFLVVCLRKFCLIQGYKSFLLDFLPEVSCFRVHVQPMSQSCRWCKIKLGIHPFTHGCPVVPAPFGEQTILHTDWGTHADDHIAAHKDSFTSSFPLWVPVFLFFCLILLTRALFLPGESQGRGAWWLPSMGSHRVGQNRLSSSSSSSSLYKAISQLMGMFYNISKSIFLHMSLNLNIFVEWSLKDWFSGSQRMCIIFLCINFAKMSSKNVSCYSTKGLRVNIFHISIDSVIKCKNYSVTHEFASKSSNSFFFF